MERIFFPLVYSSQEGLIHILLNKSEVNSLEPQIPNELDPGEWTTILTHKNDPSLAHNVDLQEWPTSLTHVFHTLEWPMTMTHENDLRV